MKISELKIKNNSFVQNYIKMLLSVVDFIICIFLLSLFHFILIVSFTLFTIIIITLKHCSKVYINIVAMEDLQSCPVYKQVIIM